MSSINKIQFDILYILKETPELTIDEIARIMFRDVETISRQYKLLIENGFISNGNVIKKGIDCLEAHKIDNAIILAAGMSTRFVPFNYEMPKGLLVVKNEVLVERQIRQLREKGIEEIIVVIGHMKEKFEYLKDKYGVILLEVSDYEEKNNHASVYAARGVDKNSELMIFS